MMHVARFFALSLLAIVSLRGQMFADDWCGSSFPLVGEVNIAYDDFRGLPEGTWNGNTGVLIGVNLGTTLFDLFGVQVGGSYGVYDWYGRGPVVNDTGGVQQQGFVTGGVFRRDPCCNGFQGGVVIDWMFNKNFGVFALDPSIGQVRFQVGYLWEGYDEFGVLGTANVNTARETVFQVPARFRAVSQVSLFWRHIFENGGESMVWAGAPYNSSLMYSGKRSGTYLIGASFRAPLTACLDLEAHGVYMGPVGNSSNRFRNYDANVCIGLSYRFGTGCESCQQERLARPYLPIANNSNFLVDTNVSD